MANIKTQCCAATTKPTSSYAHSQVKRKKNSKTAKATIDEEGFAGIFFFLSSFVPSATQTSFCTGCNETKKKEE